MYVRYQIACGVSLFAILKQALMKKNDHVKKYDMVNANALCSTTRLLEVEEDRLLWREDTADLMVLLRRSSQER